MAERTFYFADCQMFIYWNIDVDTLQVMYIESLKCVLKLCADLTMSAVIDK